MGTNANGFWDPLAPAPKNLFAMTPAEHAALLLAPKRQQPDTTVTVGAYPVPVYGKRADHMYVEFDDGSHQLIARGGPDKPGYLAHRVWTNDPVRVGAQVDPAARSPDYEKRQRVLFRDVVPGKTADEAVAGARRHAAGVNGGGTPYGKTSNSNSYAADVVEGLFGHRVGDSRTWGSGTRLTDVPRPQRDVREILGPFPAY